MAPRAPPHTCKPSCAERPPAQSSYVLPLLKKTAMLKSLRKARLHCSLLACMAALGASAGACAATTLTDTPVYSTSNVPANLMLSLSVEYPTGTVAAYTDSTGYAAGTTYLGYFDPAKCYDYNDHTGAGYFVPVSSSGPVCSGHWSGNMLNWALMTA